MARNLIGSAIALLGAAAAAWSPFRIWYDGREGRDIRIGDLFTGITAQTPTGLMGSLFLPMLIGAVLAVLGVLLRSRLVVAGAGLVVLAFAILWMVQQGLALGSLTAGGDSGLGMGSGVALGGGVLMLLGALVMRGRRPRGRRARRGRGRPEVPEGEPYGPATTEADPTHGLPPAPPPDEPWSPGHRHTS
ncbi:hypothetical protein [Streptomyces sp. 7N604]|uniref:hypothetical protein n=1 Tax=Streptomyces sp. 7N604 TaxID=3457415 RepID=UPI003FCF7D75